MKAINVLHTIAMMLAVSVLSFGIVFGQGNFSQTGTITNTGTISIKGTASFGTNGGTNKIGGTVSYTGGVVGTPQTVIAYQYNNLDLTKSGTSTGEKQFPAGTITIDGNFTLSSGVVKSQVDARTNTNTVDFDGSSGTQTVTAIDYNSLTFTNAGTRQFTTGTTKINANLTVSGGTVDATTNTPTLEFDGAGAQSIAAFDYYNLQVDTRAAGNVTFASSGTTGIVNTFSPATLTGTAAYVTTGSTFDFKGTGAQTVPVLAYNNLTISQARGTATLTLGSGEIGVAGTFNPSATGTITWSNTGNTISFNGTDQNVPSFGGYNNVKFDVSDASAHTKTATGNIAAAGSFNNNHALSTVTMGSNTLTFASASNLGTVQFAGAANGKAVGSTSGIVEYNGTGLQTITAETYYDLKISGGASGAQPTIGGATIANHDVSVTASGFLTVSGTGNLDAKNNLTNAGALTNSGTITVGQ